MSLVGLGCRCKNGGMDSDHGDRRGGGRKLTLGDGDIDDLGGDIPDNAHLVQSLVDGGCHGQSGAEGTDDD